jgi:hypothetical protein
VRCQRICFTFCVQQSCPSALCDYRQVNSTAVITLFLLCYTIDIVASLLGGARCRLNRRTSGDGWFGSRDGSIARPRAFHQAALLRAASRRCSCCCR